MRQLMKRVILSLTNKNLKVQPDARQNIEVGKVYRSYEPAFVMVKSINDDGTVTIVYEDDRTNTEYTVIPEWLS